MEVNGITEYGIEFVHRTNHESNHFQYLCREGDTAELLDAAYALQNTDVLHQYDSYGRLCTHIVAEYNGTNAQSKIEILLELGADVNANELIMGETLLHIAVWTQNYPLAEWLCQKPGVDLAAINFFHETAYHIAYKARDQRMMEILRTNGAVCDDPVEDFGDA